MLSSVATSFTARQPAFTIFFGLAHLRRHDNVIGAEYSQDALIGKPEPYLSEHQACALRHRRDPKIIAGTRFA
jgi:hypothetical protein